MQRKTSWLPGVGRCCPPSRPSLSTRRKTTCSGQPPTSVRKPVPSTRSCTTARHARSKQRQVYLSLDGQLKVLSPGPPQVQRIFQLAAYRASQQSKGVNLSNVTLSQLYNSRVRVSSGEEVSQYYVGQAMRIYTHLLSDPDLRALMIEVRRAACAPCSLNLKYNISDFGTRRRTNTASRMSGTP